LGLEIRRRGTLAGGGRYIVSSESEVGGKIGKKSKALLQLEERY